MMGTTTLALGQGATPTADEVRAALESLAEAVHDSVASGSRDQADAAMAQVNDVLAMLERSPDFSEEFRSSIVSAARGALAAVPSEGTSEETSEVPASIPDAPAAPPPAHAAAIVDQRITAMLRTARLTDRAGTLQLLNVMPLRAPVPARRHVDMFV
jgi:hypothetical protein